MPAVTVESKKQIAETPWRTVANFLPYLWTYRFRLGFALACIVLAKISGVGLPVVLKKIVDGLSADMVDGKMIAVAVVPVALLVVYFLFRFSSTFFTEMRETIFAPVTYRVSRAVLLETFRHMFSLSLSFHLERQTGAVSRDIDRGSRGITNIMSFTLYSILPTFIELAMVFGYLLLEYEISFFLVAFSALIVYVIFTIRVTNWRTKLRREMNETESRAGAKALDALINYETVKYFTNEDYEASRYDVSLREYETAGIRSQRSLSFLNLGQSAIIATAVSLLLWRAVAGVASGEMSIGDLVLVNAFMIQLYIPLNFLGTLYRMLRESLTDIERLFALKTRSPEIPDTPGAVNLTNVRGKIEFRNVNFNYRENLPTLSDISFTIEPEKTLAVVGASGAGKSTLARLLFRFYEIGSGTILVDDTDIRDIRQESLRGAIGIVPQDTVLFNDTIGFNIAYGNPEAGQDKVRAAAREAQLAEFIESLPEKYETKVGERGLKLSGGEKQRVAIARALLKNPQMLVFDEATSALDSKNEKAIREQLRGISAGKTVLIIAHRLSTIVHADEILVLDKGRIVERGNHETLLAQGGTYTEMWKLHQKGESPA